jgi:hypothetical protein
MFSDVHSPLYLSVSCPSAPDNRLIRNNTSIYSRIYFGSDLVELRMSQVIYFDNSRNFKSLTSFR